jgi:hypothetical protein
LEDDVFVEVGELSILHPLLFDDAAARDVSMFNDRWKVLRCWELRLNQKGTLIREVLDEALPLKPRWQCRRCEHQREIGLHRIALAGLVARPQRCHAFIVLTLLSLMLRLLLLPPPQALLVLRVCLALEIEPLLFGREPQTFEHRAFGGNVQLRVDGCEVRGTWLEGTLVQQRVPVKPVIYGERGAEDAPVVGNERERVLGRQQSFFPHVRDGGALARSLLLLAPALDLLSCLEFDLTARPAGHASILAQVLVADLDEVLRLCHRRRRPVTA